MDEDNHIAFEFKDKLGKVVLTRQINNGFNDTYYVYDDFGNKCFVLPSSAADGLTDKTYTGTEDALTKFAYIYRYDSRNRCIYKKLPGADPIYMIYDKADHLIFSQDGEQRSKMPKEWTFSIPDVFNRTIVTGICTDTISVKNIVLNGSFVNGNNGFMNTGYQLSNQINACTRLLTVNYYDNYDYKSLLADTIKSKLEYTVLDGYAEKYVNAVPEISAKGMLTGTRVFMLEEPAKEIITAMYYDDRGRLAQSKATNHLGGYEKDYFLYTFTGKIKKHQHIHNVPGKTTITEVYGNFYDNAERLTKTTHSLNGSNPVTLAENTYDEMGRLNSKKLHGGVETTNYSYNIRSWLKSITTEKSRFSEALYYNESSNGSIPCYNGNISAMNWKVQNENYQRGYNFHYDDLNRVTAADYQNNDPDPAFSKKSYSTNYSYDNMGNIRTLKRNGLTNNSPYNWGTIDDLTLNYNGNQLSSVVEASLKDDEPHYSGAFNFVDSLSKQIEYKYDANGNLTGDLNKKISKIQYNILNLPSAMQFCYGNTIDYLYDASGVKRKVKYVTTTENLYVELGNTLPISADKVKFTTQTDYCGNVIYENGTLNKILVDGGYITMSGTTPSYHYYILDHQGNNRVVFNQSGTVEQTNHYYPFGMTFGEGVDNSDNRYKYNGKELDRMHGLDLYDYGARHLDAAIGRWGVMDPLMERYYSVSPYIYCKDNPIRYVDPNGMKIIELDKVNMNTFDINNDNILLKGVTVTASAVTKPKPNKTGGIDIAYMGKKYTFSLRGNEFVKYQSPSNFYYYMVNKQKFKNKKGKKIAFNDIFISDDEVWKEYLTDGLIEMFEMAGGNTGPTLPGNSDRLSLNVKYAKYRWLFPPNSIEEIRDFNQKKKETEEMKLLKLVPVTFQNTEDGARLDELEKKWENKD